MIIFQCLTMEVGPEIKSRREKERKQLFLTLKPTSQAKFRKSKSSLKIELTQVGVVRKNTNTTSTRHGKIKSRSCVFSEPLCETSTEFSYCQGHPPILAPVKGSNITFLQICIEINVTPRMNRNLV